MAKADNIKQLNKIDVKKSTVTINQLEVNDEDFAQYVANAENKERFDKTLQNTSEVKIG